MSTPPSANRPLTSIKKLSELTPIPPELLRTWAERTTSPMPPARGLSPANTQRLPALAQDNVTPLNARMRRQAEEWPHAPCTPSPRSRSTSPTGDDRNTIAHLTHLNAQLMAQMAQLVSAVCTADRRDSAPPAPEPAAKPYKDYLPEVKQYSGEQPAVIPEAFLAQFRLYTVGRTRAPGPQRST